MRITRITRWLTMMSVVLWPAAAWTQDFPDLRRRFEAGLFSDVTKAVEGRPDQAPQTIYLTGQAYQRLNQGDMARNAFSRLAGGPSDNAWTFVGRSAIAVLDKNYDAALGAAQQATTLNNGLAEAHYQLGFVHALRQEFGPAASAFDRAAELDPQFAYAHYQGGLSHYRNKRPDRMASHFEMFLKVAPKAPERPEVESILRTLRGR